MMKKIFIIFFGLCLCISPLWPQGIRKAANAGTYYPDNPEMLSRQIDEFLKNARVVALHSENIVALIAPHAGYIYSGQVAASAYRLVRGKNYESVVVIAPSHRFPFHGCSIYLQGGYETPLGTAYVDEALALEISKASGFKYIAEAHGGQEHSLEVQVPFIQKTLPKAKIVPIVMGFQTRSTVTQLANALAKVLPGKNALVIASTDMSHQLPKKEANDIDSATISLIQSFQVDTLLRKTYEGENIMCGGGPVVSTLLYAQRRGKAKVEVCEYADSTQYGHGPESGVVGYLAAAISVESLPPEFTLSSEEKKGLLELARSTVNDFVRNGKVADHKTQNSNISTYKGAFVTLKKHGQLRGCIGFIEPVAPLFETVIQASIYAACRDPRFPPVSTEELEDLEIEISVLSPLRKIDSPQLIEVGKHGLFISKGDNSGLLLPQVAVENHWSRQTFLEQACLKAGLAADSWKSGAEIFIFEAIVFD